MLRIGGLGGRVWFVEENGHALRLLGVVECQAADVNFRVCVSALLYFIHDLK